MNKELKILMLEDMPADAEMAERELRKTGIAFSWKRVETREDFIRGLEDLRPDLILADHKLPAFDGISALEIVKKKCPDIPFIFVTGSMGEEWAIDTLKRGATDYVLKDRLSRLVPAVRRAMKEVEERNELQCAEDALRTTTQQLRDIFDNIDVMLFSFDYGSGRMLQVSPACEKICGASQKAFIDNPNLWIELIHGDDRLRVEARIRHLLAGKPVEVEYRIQRPDGEIGWVRGKVNPTIDASGDLVRADGFLTDISERKMAEEALHESAEQFRSLAASAQDAIVIVDNDGNICYWNDAAERIFGYTSREALGRTTPALLIPEQYHEEYIKGFALFRETGQAPVISNTIEVPARKKDGTEFPVELSTSAVKMKGKWNAIGILRDITERKRAEEELRRVNRALKTLSSCNQVLVKAPSETELLIEVCRIIVEEGGYRFTWVGYAGHDERKTVRPAAQAGYEEGYLKTVDVTWDDSERGRGPMGTAIRTGKPSLFKTALTDRDFAPWQGEALKRGYASVIGLPLIANSELFGALGIYASETDAFDEEEVKLLMELADDLAYGIVALRAREEWKKTEEELRHRLEELERFSKATIQREFRMRELKERIKVLEKQVESARD